MLYMHVAVRMNPLGAKGIFMCITVLHVNAYTMSRGVCYKIIGSSRTIQIPSNTTSTVCPFLMWEKL